MTGQLKVLPHFSDLEGGRDNFPCFLSRVLKESDMTELLTLSRFMIVVKIKKSNFLTLMDLNIAPNSCVGALTAPSSIVRRVQRKKRVSQRVRQAKGNLLEGKERMMGS